MKILAFDPGKTTGWAVIEDGEVVASGQFTTWASVAQLIAVFRPDAVVYETFRIFPHLAKSLSLRELITPQVIGVIRYIAGKFNIQAVPQQPSMKGQARRMDLTKIEGPHARDAARHGLIFWKKHRKRK